MTRSLKKGPFIDDRIIKKIQNRAAGDSSVINIWARASVITPDMIGYTFGVHNGRKHIPVTVNEDMVGHKFGEFSPTRTFNRHGGKMQKEMEQAAKQKELDASKAAKASTDSKK